MALFDASGQPVYASVPNGDPDAPDLRELGLPGTLLFSGFILEEQNPALQGRKGMDTFKAMGHDPTIAMLLKTIELPVRATRWEVDPADESPQAVELADFVHYNLWDFGSQSFDDVLRMATTGRNQYGFAPFEICYRLDDDKYPGKVCLDKLAWRAQWTRYKWNVEEIDTPDGGRSRELISMTQWAPPFYQYTVIPANKMALFVRDQTGENYDGVSLLRSCYKPWYIRDRLYSIQTVGLERGYMGIPVGKLPMMYTADMQQLMKDIVQGFRTHERAGAVVREDMGFEMLFNKLEGSAMQSAIEFFTHQIPLSALAQFTLLGSGNVGSFALSEDQSDLFLMALNGDCNYTAEVFNLDPVLPRLIRFNYPDVPNTLLPKLTHGQVGERNLDKILKGVGPLLQWGGIVPDDGFEDWLRETIGAPERDGTITPEYLQSLVEKMSPETPPKQHNQARPPIPAATNPQAQGPRVDGIPTPAPAPPVLPEPTPAQVQAHEARARFAEARARMPYRRPQGRISASERIQLRAAEQLMEFVEAMKPSAKPEAPSLRLARNRKPYRLREDVARMAEKPAKGKTVGRVEQVRLRHQRALSDFMRTLADKKPRSGHVDLPSEPLKFPLSEDAEPTDG